MKKKFATSASKTSIRSPDELSKERIPRPIAEFENPNRTILMFWPNSKTHGWADMTIRLRPNRTVRDEDFWQGYASYLTDPFGELVEAMIALADGAPQASVFVDFEPCRSELRFTKSSKTAKTITLTIFEWNPYRDEADHVVYDASLEWVEYGTARRIALKYLIDDVIWIGDQLLKTYHVEEYRQVWGWAFPTERFEHLKQLRAALK